MRLALKPEGVPVGLLDGAWWPHSRNLLRELPALTDVLDLLWGSITHITVNPAHWPVIPRKVPVSGHVVKAGRFEPEQDRHLLLLHSHHGGNWTLLVIPPRATANAAARLMAAASGTPVHTARPLTAADDALEAMERSQPLREEERQSEGSETAAAMATSRGLPALTRSRGV
ncbi:hypothetical protein GCM10012287_56570 [Streptomyces daqingensis]|uniref:Uncharacterized protein n=1 Tax=Streptomyces daqingensis TaxID=1472640 RepID=A0ABQ2MVJ7_9ACTN|nr:hypothetical protein GCM10012287_56570 [Streptomyces daqingensis]